MRKNDFINAPEISETKNTKIVSIGIIIFVVMTLYLLRLFSMQVVNGQTYRTQARRSSSKVREIPAQRGEIYDRNADQALAVNVDSFAVDITPGEIPPERFDTVISRLASYLGVNRSYIKNKLPKNRKGDVILSSFSAVEIKTNVSFATVTQIAENLVDLPGVSWRSKPVRSYVVTGSFSHIIGYLGSITPEQLKIRYNRQSNDDKRIYNENSIIGQSGIEAEYDELLQGEPGNESRTVDAKGRFISDELRVEPPKMGNNLVLTIDRTIQELAEKALGERFGSAIVLKPSTGEILAMASYPYYNANVFTTGDSGRETARILNDSRKPMMNRAVEGTYPPASTFKVIMSAAVLQEKSFDSLQKIECKGTLEYGGSTYKCHVFPGKHGKLDLKNGLAQSCNVYFWTIGKDHLGIDRIAKYARMFGYGQATEVDLPAQASGTVPTPQWKERRYHEKWVGGDTVNTSIGQGFTTVTPLHVADMMAMVVNKGVIYKPHILKYAYDPATNEITKEVKPEVLHKADIDEAVWRELQTDLRYTVTNGSAQWPLRNKVVQIAGKTGTAEIAGYKDKKHWHSWFVAYAPFDAPPEDAVVVCVSVEAVNEWEWWAPYASNIIFQGIFAKQTYEEAVEALGFSSLQKPVGRQE